MNKRSAALLIVLAACRGLATETDVPGRYCTSSVTLPVKCFTLGLRGEAMYEVSSQLRDGPRNIATGHWSFQRDKAAPAVVLAEFPLHPDAIEGGRGFQILRAEKVRNDVRLYADYDIEAYYLKQR